MKLTKPILPSLFAPAPAILLAGLIPFLGGCNNESPVGGISYTGDQQEQDALNELAAIQEEHKDAIKMTEEGLVVDQEALDKTQKATAEIADKIGGKRGQALKVMAEFQAESNKVSKEIGQRGNQFLKMLDWDTLANEGDYETRRKFMTEYAQYNRDVTAFFESAPDNISKRLDEINFQGRERLGIERGFNSEFGPMLKLVRGIRQCEITCCEIGIRVITLLEKEQGKWSVNAATGSLEFENDEAIAVFNKAINEFQIAGTRQAELQQQVLDSRR